MLKNKILEPHNYFLLIFKSRTRSQRIIYNTIIAQCVMILLWGNTCVVVALYAIAIFK